MSTEQFKNSENLEETKLGRWPSKEKKEEQGKNHSYFYSKEDLLDLFVMKEEYPSSFNLFNEVTLEKPIEPINFTKLFKISPHSKINPTSFGFGRGGKRGGRGGKRGGRGGRGGKQGTIEESRDKEYSFDSEWFYKDKNGGEVHGPYSLRKIIEWVEHQFHSAELEIKQENQTDYVKVKDIMQQLEKSGALSKLHEKNEDSDTDSIEFGKNQVKEEHHEGEQHEEEQEEEEEEEQGDQGFFSNISTIKFAQIDPWSGQPISVSEIEKNLKLALKIEEPKKEESKESGLTKEEEKRKRMFEEERKAYLEDQMKQEKTKEKEKKQQQKEFKKEEEKKEREREQILKEQQKMKEKEQKEKEQKEKEQKLKEQKEKEREKVNLVPQTTGPAWGGTNSINQITLQEIQKEQSKQKNEKIQKEKEKKQSESVWGSTKTEIVPFSEIQKEEKEKSKKKENLLMSSTNKNEVAKSIWGSSTPLNPQPVSFTKILEDEKKGKNKTPNQPTTIINTTAPVQTAWGKSEPPKKKSEKEVPKKKEEKKKEEPTLLKENESESFWEEDDEKPTFVFTSQTKTQPIQPTKTEIEKKPTQEKKKKETKPNPTGSYASMVTKPNEVPKKKNQQLDKQEFPDLPKNKEIEEDHLKKIAKPNSNSKLNVFGGIEPSDDFKKWYKQQMSLMSKSQDLTLFYYLLSLKTKKETDDYINEYLGSSNLISKFSDEFYKLKELESAPIKKK